MTPGNAHSHAAAVLARIGVMLDEDVLGRQIDGPIDEALGTFRPRKPTVKGSRDFHRVVGRLLRHLHRHALPGRRLIPLWQAKSEAVAMLEQGYRRGGGGGYAAALLDATGCGDDGLRGVLAALAEVVKQQCRRQYIRWVIAKHVDPSDWPLRCDIVAVLLERLAGWLPPRLRRSSPRQLAGELERLIALDIALRPSLPASTLDIPTPS